jgi:flagellar biosynthesis protein FlhA
LPVESLSIEVGVDLLYLVDERQGGELLQRIQRTRNQFAQDFGVVLPPIHLRDNLRLEAGEYVFQLRGEEIGRAKLHARKQLALDPGNARGDLQGIKTIDPVFGLPAYWITDGQMLRAQTKGYTVVDVPTVLTTHFVELMNSYAHELYDTSQLDRMLERVTQSNPKLVEELVPEMLSRQVLLKVFRSLVREGLSVRDSSTILEALSDYAPKTKDPDILVEFVRQRLSRHITSRFSDEDGVIHYVGLAPQVENAILQGLQTQEGGAPNLVIDPTLAQTLFTSIQEMTENFSGPSQAVILAPPLARGALRRMLERVMPKVVVLSSAELLPSVNLDLIGQVSLSA